MRHYLLTGLLVLLAFMAGWFLRDHSSASLPEPTPLPVVGEVAPVDASPLARTTVVSSTVVSAETRLNALLSAREYIQAVAFYREAEIFPDPLLYAVIQTYLHQQLTGKHFVKVLELCDIFLAEFPQDYPVAIARAQALLAMGDPRQAIEGLYTVVYYMASDQEQQKTLDWIHALVVQEYDRLSRRQQWRTLENLYQYVLSQENVYLPYYLHYAAVLMKLENYASAENYLLPLLNEEQFGEPSRQMLARIQLLQAGGQVLPLQVSGSHYIAAVTFNDATTANLMLDTGASLSVMDPAVLRQLSAGDYEQQPQQVTLQTANGNVTASLYQIHRMQLGHYSLENVAFAVLPVGNARSGFNGLLGMNVLNHFRFEIDQLNHELVLRPRQ